MGSFPFRFQAFTWIPAQEASHQFPRAIWASGPTPVKRCGEIPLDLDSYTVSVAADRIPPNVHRVPTSDQQLKLRRGDVAPFHIQAT
jgi:hypothetical protein